MKIPIAASIGVSITSVGIFNVSWVSAQYKLEVAAIGGVSDPANK